MPTRLRSYAMNDRKHEVADHRTHKARRRAAVLAAIAGVAVLAAGCGGGGLPVSAPRQDAGQPSSPSAGGAVGPQVNPSMPPGTHGTKESQRSQGFVSPSKEPAGMGSRSGVTGGALFGGTNALAQDDAKLGRKLAIVREYYHIGEKFPTPESKTLMASGSTLLVSLDSVGSGGPSYASIAAGHEDATISAFLKAMNQAARSYHLGSIYICFEHEADNPQHVPLGSPSQFVQAWDHIHQLAQSAHLNWNDGGRLHWVLILMHAAYFRVLPKWQTGASASAYWPGTNEVDIVAADGYNHYGCKQSGSQSSAGAAGLSPGDLFNPVISFASSHGGLPVFIAEWGTQAGSYASQQPAFIGQMRAYVTANREIAGAMYFDSRNPQFPACSSIINDLPASVSAMAAMGHSAGLQGRVVLSS